MQPFELLLAGYLALILLTSVFTNRFNPRLSQALQAGASLFALLQLLVEGYRWQMLPLYCYAGVVTLLAWRRWRQAQPSVPSGKELRSTILRGLLLILCLLLPTLLPVPNLPDPTGPFAIGTVAFDLVDMDRPELYGEQPGRPRRVAVRVWYPARVVAGAESAPWIENLDEQIPALAAAGGLPAFMFSHLKDVRAHATYDVPIAEAQETYPIVHFSHGYGGFNAQATFWTEELASQGFIVISTEHPYAALHTIFKDGQVAVFDPATLPEDVADEEYDLAAKRLLRQWVEDIHFVHQALGEMATDTTGGDLVDHLNFDQVLVAGHSTGGAAAIQFCAEVDFCSAVVALDPWMQPIADEVIDQGLDVPSLFMFSDPAVAYFEVENRHRFLELFTRMTAPSCDVIVADTGHHDFDDTGTFSPLAAAFGHSKGSLPIARAFTVIRTYTLAFLREVIFNEPSPLLSGPSLSYPEVSIHCRGD